MDELFIYDQLPACIWDLQSWTNYLRISREISYTALTVKLLGILLKTVLRLAIQSHQCALIVIWQGILKIGAINYMGIYLDINSTTKISSLRISTSSQTTSCQSFLRVTIKSQFFNKGATLRNYGLIKKGHQRSYSFCQSYPNRYSFCFHRYTCHIWYFFLLISKSTHHHCYFLDYRHGLQHLPSLTHYFKSLILG